MKNQEKDSGGHPRGGGVAYLERSLGISREVTKNGRPRQKCAKKRSSMVIFFEHHAKATLLGRGRGPTAGAIVQRPLPSWRAKDEAVMINLP